ncbi:hypothetical protein EYC58_00085, partial [Candidatus Saccharibacteria bacterium]
MSYTPTPSTWKKISLWTLVFLLLALLVLGVVGWVGAGKLLAVNPQKVEYDQTVEAVDGNNYTISGSAYNIQGVAGGIRTDGSMIGIFSAPTSSDASKQTATRQLTDPNGSALSVGEKISLQGNVWTSDPKAALGLDYETVQYESPLGATNAWLVPGKSKTTWTIGVHGIGADKNEMLRFVKPVHAAGNTMLVINYRNDPGNPQSADDYNHFGDTEWQDVKAAVAYAKEQGATDIRLYGDSLGGSLVENYLKRAGDPAVSKVVLDSPALDWKQVIQRQIQKNSYPGILYYPTVLAMKLRAGVDVNSISTQASDIKHKTLIIHSSDDPTVPQAASKELAAAKPDLVTLSDFGQGGHLRSWNHDTA